MIKLMNDYSPENEKQAADIIRHHAASGQKLLISAGGTRWISPLIQNSPAHALLRSTALTGIVAYNPHEMVMTVRAGTPISQIEAALAENGQMMAFEAVDHRGLLKTSGEPTIGGLFATNASGPRRFVAGAARDSLLGLRFVNGRGEIVKNGGRVMKNVTGLDLVKLLAGSFGSLGFISEVTFRVPPRYQSSCSIAITGLTDSQAITAMAQAMALPVSVSGAAHIPASLAHHLAGGGIFSHATTLLRLEGLPHSLSGRREKLKQAMSDFGSVMLIEQELSLQLWREIGNVCLFADGTQRPIWRISVAPSHAPEIVGAMMRDGKHNGRDVFYDWQGGLLWMRMERGPHGAHLRHLIKAHGGGHATLIRASAADGTATPIFQPPDAAEAFLSMRVKQAFDPVGIFLNLWTGHS